MAVRVSNLAGVTAMETMDDISLLKAIAERRDHAAFAELCERCHKRAFNLAFRILRNPAAAEDAVQEAMLAVWLSAGSFQPDRGNPQSWILSIVMNKCVNLGAAQRQRAKREERLAMERSSLESESTSRIEDRELIVTLRSHLDRLPDLDGRILACCYGANMSHQKAAEFLGIPRRTVSEKIQRALDSLRGSLLKAGVAAVVPLLSAENLFEAMTTGHECPPGMGERIVRHVTSAGRSARALPRRPVPAKGGIGMFLAVGAVAAVAVGVVASRGYFTPNPNSAAPTLAPAPDALHLHWSFEKEAPADLRVLQQSWTWKYSEEKKTGYLATPSGESNAVFVTLPFTLPAQPVLIHSEAFLPLEGVFALSAMPMRGNQVLPTVRWRTFYNLRGTTVSSLQVTHHSDIYIVDHHIVQLLDGHVMEIRVVPEAATSIALGIRNWGLLSMDVKTISPADLPAPLKDVPALILTMKEGPEKENVPGDPPPREPVRN